MYLFCVENTHLTPLAVNKLQFFTLMTKKKGVTKGLYIHFLVVSYYLVHYISVGKVFGERKITSEASTHKTTSQVSKVILSPLLLIHLST